MEEIIIPEIDLCFGAKNQGINGSAIPFIKNLICRPANVPGSIIPESDNPNETIGGIIIIAGIGKIMAPIHLIEFIRIALMS